MSRAPSSFKEQLRAALEGGEELTRTEACERYGATGSTFRWAIASLQREGLKLTYSQVPGKKGSTARRWRVARRSRRT